MLYRQVLDLGHHSRPDIVTNLANTVINRFDQEGQLDTLDEAISLLRQALELRSPGQPNQTITLNILGSTLGQRFEETGLKRRFPLQKMLSDFSLHLIQVGMHASIH